MKISNKISVIMSVYNEKEEYLRSAIESIINQTYTNLQFIIILDNPNNKILENIIIKYANLDNRIIFLKNNKNIGLAKSLNRGLGIAEGDYIARMDADDIAYESRLEKQLQYSINNKIDILGTGIELISEDNNLITIPFTVKRDKVTKVLPLHNVIAHPTWFVKKEVYKELEGYRNIHTAEDYDFLLRAHQRGFVIDNLDEVLLKYRIVQSSISRANNFKQYLTTQYMQRHYKLGYTVEEISNYVEKVYNKKNEEKYRMSIILVNKLSTSIKNKKSIESFKLCIRLLLHTKYTLKILFDILKLKLIVKL